MIERISEEQAEILREWTGRKTEYFRGEELHIKNQIPHHIIVVETMSGHCYLIEVLEPRTQKVRLYRICHNPQAKGFRGEREINPVIAIGERMLISIAQMTSEVRKLFTIDYRDLPGNWQN